MVYFRHSFTNNFAWTGRIEEFWTRDVTETVDPIPGAFDGNGGVARYVSYPGTGIDGELVGWNAFSWFIVWMCICKGVGVTGRVVYISIGLPMVINLLVARYGRPQLAKSSTLPVLALVTSKLMQATIPKMPMRCRTHSSSVYATPPSSL